MKRNISRTCNGKKRYRDAEEAKAALRTLRTKSSRAVLPVRHYRCPRCKGYHLTSEER